MTTDHFFSINHAFDNPVTLWIVCGIIVILCIARIFTYVVNRRAKLDSKLRDDLVKRVNSWLIIAPLMIGPILIGRIPTILAVGLLSVLAHREFARATGLFRDSLTSGAVVVAILITTFSCFDNWYGLFMAVIPLTIVMLAGINVASDNPSGYLQRVALGILSFGLFGSALGHMGMIANDRNFRAILVWMIFCVQINDVAAYISGKSLGRHKLLPQTSPGKTVEGAVGAVVITTTIAAVLAHTVFRGTVLAGWAHGIVLGFMISILGQLGDLVISSVKRDVGIKDMGKLFPGHGGLLDRFDSLILVAPAVFHYVNYFVGVANDQHVRIISAAGS